ncbi:hypothetical protein F5Y18DRAFT_391936 [Xylariaceae sp. FL1019]|nr:hypothetical protein F5Y18DRAFT_391936 [Xylariaceae sp. FL1019]
MTSCGPSTPQEAQAPALLPGPPTRAPARAPAVMADESYASGSTTTLNLNSPASASRVTASSATSNDVRSSSPEFPLRRAATASYPCVRRRIPSTNPPSSAENHTSADLRRRSSTYSDLRETSADELLNPSKSDTDTIATSHFVYIPLILALLPALAGIFFENGAAFFTDLTLLSIAALFLHWSVTQPWDWYRTAQQVRVAQDEILNTSVFDSDSDGDSAQDSPITALEEVPEETDTGKGPEEFVQVPQPKQSKPRRSKRWEERQAAAVKELYVYETFALLWCFVFPMLSCYLLHTIRGQLTRPSEGLVSDYNLTIFLCAAEVRPVAHFIKMVQLRTIFCQSIVARNPYAQRTKIARDMQALNDRLDDLEARPIPVNNDAISHSRPEELNRTVESVVGNEFRRSVQPELEALNRAMRRYEKKLTLLASQTDNRIEYVDYRLNDAIALAAVAAKNSNSRWPITSWLLDKTTTFVVFPIRVVEAIVTFPFRTASTLFQGKSRAPPERGQRSLRNGRLPGQGRTSNYDRVPTRLSRR